MWAVLIAAAGCTSAVSSTPSTSPLLAGRLGTHPLQFGSKTVGTITVRSLSVAAVQVQVALDDPGQIHPWELSPQADCSPPAGDRDSPFQFADIEGGTRAEELEAGPFLAFPAPLTAIVLSQDGSQVYGCADLGGSTAAAADPTDSVCTAASPTAGPKREDQNLAYSGDYLSNADIYLMSDRGTNVQRLTTALGIDIKPTWSPDGGQIAFRSVRDGQDEIYVMNADGSCQRNLTNDPADDRSPAWSPDGMHIAFDHFFTSRYQDIAVMNVDGTGRAQLTRSSGEYPAWSPDGKRIAFGSARDGDYEVYVINADGSDEVQLTHNSVYDFYPAWSADGNHIVYESAVDATALELHVMRADGAEDRRITDNGAENRFPAWAADGRLAWSRDGALVVAQSLGGEPIEIGRGQFPAWRP